MNTFERLRIAEAKLRECVVAYNRAKDAYVTAQSEVRHAEQALLQEARGVKP